MWRALVLVYIHHILTGTRGLNGEEYELIFTLIHFSVFWYKVNVKTQNLDL